ncbi:hypothetical protein [Streptomyces griseocarneus]|uniref:hypothetical protein n=1 Tax=Streptomyces griseocarneus TaxID=51201 RepID=UPI00167DA3F4|nr:hypothetical protein [Streptomyces griseocarneus]MBZ6475069.1 hypothetical protein [Streptomyces griseocarneus]GHG62437.1 hypothetical protein GCM10018779_31130 [Streptomyces griseocarneus]
MDACHQPTLDEIEGRFVALVDGRLTRDEADRWAGRWVADDGLVWDDISWWALSLLHGIDLPADESGAYLHDDEQLRAWLAELRKRRTM